VTARGRKIDDVARELVEAERASLTDVHQRGLIDNVVMRRAEAMLDTEELHLDRLSRVTPGGSEGQIL
jgi:hypothetical protein